MVQDDGLKEELRKRQNYITRCITNAAQLISEKIERGGYESGFDWCVEQLRQAGHIKLANEVELAKASKFMSNKEFEAAVTVFKVGALIQLNCCNCCNSQETCVTTAQAMAGLGSCACCMMSAMQHMPMLYVPCYILL